MEDTKTPKQKRVTKSTKAKAEASVAPPVKEEGADAPGKRPRKPMDPEYLKYKKHAQSQIRKKWNTLSSAQRAEYIKNIDSLAAMD